MDDPVAGYLFSSGFNTHRNQTVCKIVARAEVPDPAHGVEPAFLVRFADGHEQVALSQQLHPWFPT